MSDQYKEPEIDQEDPTTEPEYEEYHHQEVWAEGSYRAEPETAPAVPVERKGNSIASFVLGIISILLYFTTFPALICAVIGLVMGISGKKQGGKSFAVAGIVLSIIGLVSAVLFVVGMVFIMSYSFDLIQNGIFEEFMEFDLASAIIRIFR